MCFFVLKFYKLHRLLSLNQGEDRKTTNDNLLFYYFLMRGKGGILAPQGSVSTCLFVQLNHLIHAFAVAMHTPFNKVRLHFLR